MTITERIWKLMTTKRFFRPLIRPAIEMVFYARFLRPQNGSKSAYLGDWNDNRNGFFLKVDDDNQLFQVGDIYGNNNSTVLQVDDNNQVINLNSDTVNVTGKMAVQENFSMQNGAAANTIMMGDSSGHASWGAINYRIILGKTAGSSTNYSGEIGGYTLRRLDATLCCNNG